MQNNLSGIIIFTKVPKIGFVKTRLQHPKLDDHFIVSLQTAMLKDTIMCLKELSEEFTPILTFFPEKDSQLLKKYVVNPLKESHQEFFDKFHIIPQKGRDLAERFSFVFNFAFHELELSSNIIIGSDTPHIQPRVMNQSMGVLKHNINQAVLGPSQNGGFYLLGYNNPPITNVGSIFDIKSSYNELISATELLSNYKDKIHILPEVTDVDTFEDLKTVRSIVKMLSYPKITFSKSVSYYYPQFTAHVLDSVDESIWFD
ncbi:MAG: TIGR04282 family arsenosugar biosynthesis glycosyltransferase [Candidatus Hodarchaeales archaeon]|jgi:glycosyltransferase A (GT-A) superfamily protein (DUF2064 family)